MFGQVSEYASAELQPEKNVPMALNCPFWYFSLFFSFQKNELKLFNDFFKQNEHRKETKSKTCFKFLIKLVFIFTNIDWKMMKMMIRSDGKISWQTFRINKVKKKFSYKQINVNSVRIIFLSILESSIIQFKRKKFSK